MPNKCELCDKTDIRFALSEYAATGITTINYCGALHATLDMMKRYAKIVKANSSTNTVRAYQTAVVVLTKLVKILEKEWKATAKK